ncbi:DUF3109 family protein [Riemerella anatipestifer]|uniref:DUF3109 domain-containing protein n=1 Tax=Riemerella anatipestifer (strain ATCC 11845 / DSM 15868 / JCM 9532 / NCTC 11014) TaxID=693978 RepID=E4TDB1_RIEAD|nr:DUF3109 family protein [Riemerella anatipestifer]ADQ82770.1 hypothetical protein Riean_1613 [Riemerella anatipestifer ATCC 11845 = DSM 15868]ADZ11737.1 Protein of unknown function DUF3109 [Riemerella anatipestifer RA-GD]AFD56781.1 hypothetical protein RA0C_1908 [Riemerella anatipestifer ATCC 11845 = DSM 15868]AGC41278.1 hypothetical protein G148_1974 [Riemerella anatipestifer RA-CH-2]AKP69948.1 hypothetical protein CG08_1816 [Riemerella anatipestifer]
MIQIEDKLISEDLFSEEFVCNLSKCKGACCIEGDAGAPLEQSEIKILEDIYPKIKSYLRPEGIKAIEEQGTSVEDFEGDLVTPLIDNRDCAYVIFDENGITKCGIEKAYEEGAIDWPKPISCHLYPIRITEYSTFTAFNYHEWKICSDACALGKELKVPVYKFLKTPLIRKYGEGFYQTLTEAAEEYERAFGNRE